MESPVLDLTTLDLDKNIWGDLLDKSETSDNGTIPDYGYLDDKKKRIETVFECDLWTLDHANKIRYDDRVIKVCRDLENKYDEDAKMVAADLLTIFFEEEPHKIDRNVAGDKREIAAAVPVRDVYLTAINAQPEFLSLKRRACMSLDVCRDLATTFLRHYERYLNKLGLQKKEYDRIRGAMKKDGLSTPARRRLVDELKKTLDKMTGLAGHAVELGCEEARERFGKLRSLEELLGEADDGGEGLDSGGYSTNLSEILGLYKTISKNRLLLSIVEKAGKLVSVYKAAKSKKNIRKDSEIVGLRLDNKLDRMIVSEKLRLSHPVLRVDVLRRLLNGQALCKDVKPISRQAKGAVIITVDESGSMCGAHNIESKAIALSMLHVARAQKRWCGLVSYSGGKKPRWTSFEPEKKIDHSILLGWLSSFLDGGSNLDIPIAQLPSIYEEMKAKKGQTDVIMITDGNLCIDSYQDHKNLAVEFNKWKSSIDCRVYGLSLCRVDQLARVCDETYLVSTLGSDDLVVQELISTMS